MQRLRASSNGKTQDLVLALTAALTFASCFGPESETCPSGLVCPPDTHCAANQDVCIRTECGNGVVDANVGEVCDDGNILDGDGCSADCKSNETCGNGVVDANVGEVCDDGNSRPGDGCSSDCRSGEGCGNGKIDLGEECDDGNAHDDDDCPTTCRVAYCGDGFTDNVGPRREQCDTGGESATCNFNCTLARCGDNLVNASAGEQCDEGGVDTWTCNSTCTVAFCGDSHTNPARGEHCDTGGNSATCDADCTVATCGDGFPNSAHDEQCDTGGDSMTCDADCTPVACGDRHLNPAANEQCDDGNDIDTDDCVSNCRLNVCGDGLLDMQTPDVEVCDDGNNINEWSCPYGTPTCRTCNHDCTAVLVLGGPYCGDGTPNHSDGEVCDDGNNVTEQSCDYGERTCTKCDAACATELTLAGPFCGDGILNGPPGAEVCDDGNNIDETSCPYGTPSCTRCNSTCSAFLNLTGAYCGDGTKNGSAGENCDDGNMDACGTCNPTCTQTQWSGATGRIIAVAADQLSDGQTFTLYDGINPATIFNFDVEDDGVPDGHVQVNVPVGANANTMALSIESAIDHARPLRIVSAATDNVVNVYHLDNGSFGNQAITETVVDPGFEVSGMIGGSGRDCPIGVGCRIDSDCALGLTCQGTGPKTCQPSP